MRERHHGVRLPILAALALASTVGTHFGGSIALAAEEAEAPGAVIGSEAPDFTLMDPDGVEHRLGDLHGESQVVLVFFRGTW